MIYDEIAKDIKAAMIEKNETKRDCLRSVVSEIKNRTVNEGKELTESVCVSVLKKAAKQRADSIASFEKGGRADLVSKEKEELGYIEKYLPEMYPEERVREIVSEIIAKNGIAGTKSETGRVMKLVDSREDRDLIDKKIVSACLRGILK